MILLHADGFYDNFLKLDSLYDNFLAASMIFASNGESHAPLFLQSFNHVIGRKFQIDINDIVHVDFYTSDTSIYTCK